MFLSIPIIKKCQILICDTLVANEQYVVTACPDLSVVIIIIIIIIIIITSYYTYESLCINPLYLLGGARWRIG